MIEHMFFTVKRVFTPVKLACLLAPILPIQVERAKQIDSVSFLIPHLVDGATVFAASDDLLLAGVQVGMSVYQAQQIAPMARVVEPDEAIVETRGQMSFRLLADFIERTGLDRRRLESLILAGAFDSLGERRQLLWDLAEAFDIARRPQALPLHIADEHVAMRPMADNEKLVLTFATTAVTAGMHLAEVRRDAFARAGCLSYHYRC